jgi:predicted rRNA methylase YqxC with S4 and FtsJ domains
MKQFKKEYLTQHLLVLCAMSIIGALVRNEAMQYGVDTFSCNLTFVISTTILMVVYLHALDSIVRLLAPWFKQKQRKVNMRGMNCKWLRMSNIS